jgi:Ca2+-binding EF-hand superfamily protein
MMRWPSCTITWRRYSFINIFDESIAAHHSIQDELTMMRDLFQTMDLDDVGKIRWDQARVVMAKMGRKLTDDQFAKLVDRYDLDKNGTNISSSALARALSHNHSGDLEFSEFCSMYLDHMKRRIKNNDTLLEVFAFLDRHENGRVSREDVRTL